MSLYLKNAICSSQAFHDFLYNKKGALLYIYEHSSDYSKNFEMFLTEKICAKKVDSERSLYVLKQHQEVEDVMRSLPAKIDDTTRLNRVIFDGRSYSYDYSLLLDSNSLSPKAINSMKLKMHDTVIKSACSSDKMLIALKFIEMINYNYFDKQNRMLFSVSVSPSSCH